jgi:acyl dehydratase
VFGGAVLAFLRASQLRHTAPCFIGETISVTVTVLDVRPSRQPDRATCTMRYEVTGQSGEALMTAEMIFLMHR